MFQAFCLSIFYFLLATTTTKAQTQIEVSLPTLKADLQKILEDSSGISSANIQYAEGTELQLTIDPDIRGGKHIQIDGLLSLKLTDGSVVRISNVRYFSNGSFGLGQFENQAVSIIIPVNPNREPQLAELNIIYMSKRKLTDDILLEKAGTGGAEDIAELMLKTPIYRLGWFILHLVSPLKGRVPVKEPLKGISLQGRHYQDDVYFDVWYDPVSNRYGSSSGSLDNIDAFRAYEEWPRDIRRETLKSLSRREVKDAGNEIRERMLQHDLQIIYHRLHDQDPFTNAIISYGTDIVLEVRAGVDGDRRYVTATGTTGADPLGKGPLNVNAYYDPNKMEYDDEVRSAEEFVAMTYGEKSCYFKYTDFRRFKDHLRAIWAAMRGGCSDISTKDVYFFSIFYGDSIRIMYSCPTNTVVLKDTILLLTDVPDFEKTVISRCEDMEYLYRYDRIETPCLEAGVTPIAIQQEPEKLWPKHSEPVFINARVVEAEMKFLNESLKKSVKQSLAMFVIDGNMLFGVKTPEGVKRPGYVEVHGRFKTQNKASEGHEYKIMKYSRAGLAAPGGKVQNNDTILISADDFPLSEVDGEKFVGAKYVTIEKLREYLKKVSEEAFKRCASWTKTRFLFKLVQHNRFALEGITDCSEGVILVEGRFKALLFNRDDNSKTEVGTERLVEHFIYVSKDQFLIAGRDSFDDVLAISVPEMKNIEEARQSFGAPISIDDYSSIWFRS